jgi:hypothetical protein
LFAILLLPLVVEKIYYIIMIRLSRCFKRIFGHLLVPRQSYLKHYSTPNQTFSVAFFQAAAWGDVLYSVHFLPPKTP